MGMGHKKWCFPDLYVTEAYSECSPSHECISFANNGKNEAIINLIAVFEDEQDPIVIHNIEIKPMKSLHFRLDKLSDYGVKLPIRIPYSVFIDSSENIVACYARMNWIEGKMQSFGYIGYFED